MTRLPSASEAWNEEYRNGRYLDEPPVRFVEDILTVSANDGIVTGLYVGCGNGRNLLPLVDRGLDLVGLDISDEAIRQLSRRRPDRSTWLHSGDLQSLPTGRTWPLLIGIQVFQHGDRHQAHQHVHAAQQRVQPGGLFCLRVNATGTDLRRAHDVTERHPDGGFTVRYTAGHKNGLTIHFFSADELTTLVRGWPPVLPIRPDYTLRNPPTRGRWTQWEAIWRRPH